MALSDHPKKGGTSLTQAKSKRKGVKEQKKSKKE